MLNLFIFSPTGNSKRVGLAFANELNKDSRVIDLTKTHQSHLTFSPDDIVVVAGPVFGGRMPSLMLERLRTYPLAGNRVITMVTYGNRAYEDALLELNDTVAKMGGLPVASAALVASHSMVPAIAKDRPNDVDLHNLKVFARAVKQKLQAASLSRIQVPGNFPYRSWTKAPMVPVIEGQCIKCGDCVRNCPAGAISSEDPTIIDETKCILCMRCVSQCKQHARVLPEPVRVMITKKLEPIAHVFKKVEFFV